MCINSRILVFNLNKIAKVLSDNIVCLSKTLLQFFTGRHIDTKKRTNRQEDKHAGRKAKRQTVRQTGRQTLLRSGGKICLLKCANLYIFFSFNRQKTFSCLINLLIILLRIISLNTSATSTNIKYQQRDCCVPQCV